MFNKTKSFVKKSDGFVCCSCRARAGARGREQRLGSTPVPARPAWPLAMGLPLLPSGEWAGFVACLNVAGEVFGRPVLGVSLLPSWEKLREGPVQQVAGGVAPRSTDRVGGGW